MAKEGKTREVDDSKKAVTATEKVEERVERKVEESPDPVAAVNIIGDIKKPDPEDKESVIAYFKKIDAKLDQLLNPKKTEIKTGAPIPEPETLPKNEEKKLPWYDREIPIW